MKNIIDKELVIKIDGSIKESNLDDFETTATIVLDKINISPKSDDEFVVAKQNVKDCQLVEDRIYNARRTALAEADEIFNVVSKTEKIQESFRQKRLTLNKNIKTEEAARKKTVIDSGKKIIKDFLSTTKVKNLYVFDYGLVAESIKGKSSLLKMEEAVGEVYSNAKKDITAAEDNYNTNHEVISKSLAEYPGIYPDIDQLSMKDELLVGQTIENRVAKYKLGMIEKKEKEAAFKEGQDRARREIADIDNRRMAMAPPPPPPPIKNIVVDSGLDYIENKADLHKIKVQNDVIGTLTTVYSVNPEMATRIVKAVSKGEFLGLFIVY